MKVSRASTGAALVAAELCNLDGHDYDQAALHRCYVVSTLIMPAGSLVYVPMCGYGLHRSGYGDLSGAQVERTGENDGSELRLVAQLLTRSLCPTMSSSL